MARWSLAAENGPNSWRVLSQQAAYPHVETSTSPGIWQDPNLPNAHSGATDRCLFETTLSSCHTVREHLFRGSSYCTILTVRSFRRRHLLAKRVYPNGYGTMSIITTSFSAPFCLLPFLRHNLREAERYLPMPLSPTFLPEGHAYMLRRTHWRPALQSPTLQHPQFMHHACGRSSNHPAVLTRLLWAWHTWPVSLHRVRRLSRRATFQSCLFGTSVPSFMKNSAAVHVFFIWSCCSTATARPQWVTFPTE